MYSREEVDEIRWDCSSHAGWMQWERCDTNNNGRKLATGATLSKYDQSLEVLEGK